MKYILTILLLSLTLIGFTQNLCVSYPFRLENSNIEIYNETTRIYFASIQEDSINMSNPEEFLGSYLTASNQSWMNKHFVTKEATTKLSDKKIQERKNFDPNLDFVSLVHKFSFTLHKVDHIIFKVYTYKKGRKKGARAYHIYKNNKGNWIINNTLSGFERINSIIKKIKSEPMLKVMMKNNQENNPILKEAIDNSFTIKNVFDIDLFQQLSINWVSNNEMDKYNFFYGK